MKILVTSDIHGKTHLLKAVRDLHPDIDYHLDAGDSGLTVKEIEQYNILSVKGNTDYFLNLPQERIISTEENTIYMTHGHTLDVKYGTAAILAEAKKNHANICIYGHTHQPMIVKDEILLLNPGSLKDFPYTYIIIENNVATLHELN
ncbi:MAG: YfcE family phosphodiesterase [Candidatus Phytoplasma sp.]|nr:YfcE family phosphodiesterase [Phytoplasma sp.]